jgi:hypothetical protein
VNDDSAPQGQLLIYGDGGLNLQVRLDGQTVWLTQAQMADLYQTSKQNISLHIQNVLDDKELPAEAVVKEYLTTAADGKKYRTLHYSLDVILAVGYRVRSPRGTLFRQWATTRLRELLVKGFTMDDERIKAGRTIGADYFDELLARIRDIRANERLFYQKITDIYATSIDYDANAEMTQLFFQTVQNKMHWAAHGHTAAEIIRQRADADKPNIGLRTWKNAPGGPVRKGDLATSPLTQADAHGRLDCEVGRFPPLEREQHLDQRRPRLASTSRGTRPLTVRDSRTPTPRTGSVQHKRLR